MAFVAVTAFGDGIWCKGKYCMATLDELEEMARIIAALIKMGEIEENIRQVNYVSYDDDEAPSLRDDGEPDRCYTGIERVWSGRLDC